MIYRKGRFRKKQTIFWFWSKSTMLFGKKKEKIQILGKQKNGATKLFHWCWDITPKRHLSKDMVFQWYSCQMRHFVSISFYPTKARYFFSIHYESTQAFSIKRWEIKTKLFLTPWNHVFLNFCLRYNCQDRQPSPSKLSIVVLSHHHFKWTVWYFHVLICSCQKNSYAFSKPYPRCALKLLVYSDLKNIFNSKN